MAGSNARHFFANLASLGPIRPNVGTRGLFSSAAASNSDRHCTD